MCMTGASHARCKLAAHAHAQLDLGCALGHALAVGGRSRLRSPNRRYGELAARPRRRHSCARDGVLPIESVCLVRFMKKAPRHVGCLSVCSTPPYLESERQEYGEKDVNGHEALLAGSEPHPSGGIPVGKTAWQVPGFSLSYLCHSLDKMRASNATRLQAVPRANEPQQPGAMLPYKALPSMICVPQTFLTTSPR